MSAREVLAITHAPAPYGSYITFDATLAEFSSLMKAGFRWVRTDGESAVFEREFHCEPPVFPVPDMKSWEAQQAIAALRAMVEDREESGEPCDCRPEPENDGHVCSLCRARNILSIIDGKTKQTTSDEP
jgi:hypothetical protein